MRFLDLFMKKIIQEVEDRLQSQPVWCYISSIRF